FPLGHRLALRPHHSGSDGGHADPPRPRGHRRRMACQGDRHARGALRRQCRGAHDPVFDPGRDDGTGPQGPHARRLCPRRLAGGKVPLRQGPRPLHDERRARIVKLMVRSPVIPNHTKETTMIEMLSGLPAHTIGFKMSGKLHDEDYKKFVPLVDAEIAKEGKVNILAQFHDFHGWDLHALWDDIKFSTTHCTKIKRIALVGEKTWEKWMANVCKPFTMAKIHYFDSTDVEAAKKWLAEA